MCLNCSGDCECPSGMVSVNGTCLIPCSNDFWNQAFDCQDYETCSDAFCRPLSCVSDTDCNGFECNTNSQTCTRVKSGLINIPLILDGSSGTTVAGSPPQFNEAAFGSSTLSDYSPRTSYSILYSLDDNNNMYDPAASWSVVHGCETSSP